MFALSPEEARKYLIAGQVSTYVVFCTLTIIIWNILTNISEEYRLILSQRLSVPNVAYISSRSLTVGYAIGQTVYLVADISDCQLANRIVGSFFFLSTATVTFLFLLRVIGVFNSSLATKIFSLLWLITLAFSALDPVFVDGVSSAEILHSLSSSDNFSHLGASRCTYSNLNPKYRIITAVVVLSFDTVVYLAISIRLFCIFPHPHHDRYSESEPGLGNISRMGIYNLRTVGRFFNGTKLPVFSKGLLRDGQLYYMISFLLCASLGIMILIPSLPVPYHLVLAPPYAIGTNIMACYVFRHVRKMGLGEQEVELGASWMFSTQSGLQFASFQSGV